MFVLKPEILAVPDVQYHAVVAGRSVEVYINPDRVHLQWQDMLACWPVNRHIS
jgi:hypothetical protein